jgi:hypothetical protein
MIVVKYDWFSQLAKPISELLFGSSKTYRGFIILPVLTGTIALANNLLFGPFGVSLGYTFFIGLVLGFAYLLFELPNSYFKRRLGIAPGEQSEKYRILQFVIDKLDSLIGVLLFYYLFMSISFYDLLVLFAVAFLIHITISYLLVLLNIKRSI